MRRIILFLNYIFVLALLLSYLSIYIDPSLTTIFAFLGLTYPILLLVNIIFVIIWIFAWKRYVFISLIAIIIGWNFILRHYQISGSDLPEDGISSLEVLSFNVKNLANSNYSRQNIDMRNSIFSYLINRSSDLVCLQEFRINEDNADEILYNLKTGIGLPYYYHHNYREKQSKIDAIITFSAFPIIHKGTIGIDDGRVFSIYTDIIQKKDTLRIYNVHLESIRFRDEDYEFVSELARQSPMNTEFTKGSANVLRKLDHAFRKRSIQVRALRSHIEDSPYPVILCGDFNDTPSSYAYQRISNYLEDAFIISGRGYGNTYSGDLPSLRIDFIFYDPSFTAGNFEVDSDVELSDHYPVSCKIQLDQ